jgi:hypothetical protein
MTKHSQDIIRDMQANEAHSIAVNRLLADIDSLKGEVWVLRTTLFVAVVGLILLSVSKAFGG